MLALALALTVHMKAPSTPCAYDKAAMLALPPDRFDQDKDGGWRSLANKQHCYKAAADLLATYRRANWSKLGPNELHINYFHEGQMRAFAGDYPSAIKMMLAGENPEPDIGGTFAEYIIGSVAFLNHDHAALTAARARLAKAPPPAEWVKMAADYKTKYGQAPSWPPNLDVLDNLLACFDKPYAKAYDRDCKAEPVGK